MYSGSKTITGLVLPDPGSAVPYGNHLSNLGTQVAGELTSLLAFMPGYSQACFLFSEKSACSGERVVLISNLRIVLQSTSNPVVLYVQYVPLIFSQSCLQAVVCHVNAHPELASYGISNTRSNKYLIDRPAAQLPCAEEADVNESIGLVVDPL